MHPLQRRMSHLVLVWNLFRVLVISASDINLNNSLRFFLCLIIVYLSVWLSCQLVYMVETSVFTFSSLICWLFALADVSFYLTVLTCQVVYLQRGTEH